MARRKKLSLTLRLRALAAGPLPRGHHRAIVIEPDARVSVMDFENLDEAIGYANDAASETDDRPPLAYVVDRWLRVVHEGRHYALGGRRKIDHSDASTPFDWVDDD